MCFVHIRRAFILAVVALLTSPSAGEASGKLLKCTLKSVDADKSTITISLGRAERKFQVTTDARILMLDRRPGELSGLPLGAIVLLGIENATSKVYQIKVGSLPSSPIAQVDDTHKESSQKSTDKTLPEKSQRASLNQAYAIRSSPARAVVVEQAFRYIAVGLAQPTWVVAAAVPPILPSQPHITMETSPKGECIPDIHNESRKIIRIRVSSKEHGAGNDIVVKAHYEAMLAARQLVSRNASDSTHALALTDKEWQAYTAPTLQFDFKTESFMKWLRQSGLVINRNEGEVNFGLRVFSFLKANYAYAAFATDVRASVVCHSGQSHCSGLSSLFVTIMRANNVAARTLVGRLTVSATPGATIGDFKNNQQHVKAEFYAHGVGWIPVEVASAVSNKAAPITDHFGTDKGDFITMHVDFFLELDTLIAGKQAVGAFQDFSRWVVGKGRMKEIVEDQRWVVEIK